VDDAVRYIRDALAAGELTESDLTARRIGARLGKTTSVLYHHWGSLDRFLFDVSQDGYLLLTEVLLAAGPALPDIAEAFIAFGLDRPVLYRLMFERPWPWDDLRAAGAFEGAPGLALWGRVVDRLAAAGSTGPRRDGLLLHAALHGLVSLANSGRANVGDLTVTARGAAGAAARNLAARICAPSPEPKS